MRNASDSLTPVVPPAAAEAPDADVFTADAQQWMARLRAMAAEFEEAHEQRPLTRFEMGVARRTPLHALEKAAVFAEAAGLGDTIGSLYELRSAVMYELAYGGVRDEAYALGRRVDAAILRRKHKASLLARALYGFGKSIAKLSLGDLVKTHIEDLKHALVPSRRRKPVRPEPSSGEKE
jgi:hypothetical protein